MTECIHLFTGADGQSHVKRTQLPLGRLQIAADTTGTGDRWRLIDDQPWRRLYVELPAGPAPSSREP